MKDQLERWIILPFSMSCASESSVCISIGSSHPKTLPSTSGGEKGTGKSSSSVKKKSGSAAVLFPFRKPGLGIARGFQRLIKNLRSNISQLFAYKNEEEEEEVEMQIGLPTDVKHLTHIGWDGSTTINPTTTFGYHPFKGWGDDEDNMKAQETVKLPSISLEQFEMAMAAQADPQSVPQHQQTWLSDDYSSDNLCPLN